MIYTYDVTRYVVERYCVEVESESKPTSDQVRNAISDPYSVEVSCEIIKPREEPK